MKLIETAKFKKLRKKIKSAHEKEVLKEAIIKIMEDPEAGKLLKGEFRDLRSFRYTVKGQSRRHIYKIEKDTLVLFSFGPREGIYK
ncbi:MAG: type II toxin-antitoxin system RelE/ParE family toxin [Candidatus Aminicenantes bacterium]|nr:type II toxin-antitoxin system RelE/ParE family toxin [Candidatus Aminicenantes bacterium]